MRILVLSRDDGFPIPKEYLPVWSQLIFMLGLLLISEFELALNILNGLAIDWLKSESFAFVDRCIHIISRFTWLLNCNLLLILFISLDHIYVAPVRVITLWCFQPLILLSDMTGFNIFKQITKAVIVLTPVFGFNQTIGGLSLFRNLYFIFNVLTLTTPQRILRIGQLFHRSARYILLLD